MIHVPDISCGSDILSTGKWKRFRLHSDRSIYNFSFLHIVYVQLCNVILWNFLSNTCTSSLSTVPLVRSLKWHFLVSMTACFSCGRATLIYTDIHIHVLYSTLYAYCTSWTSVHVLNAIYSAGINSSGTGGGPMAGGYENIRRTNVLDSFMPVHVGPPKTTTWN